MGQFELPGEVPVGLSSGRDTILEEWIPDPVHRTASFLRSPAVTFNRGSWSFQNGVYKISGQVVIKTHNSVIDDSMDLELPGGGMVNFTLLRGMLRQTISFDYMCDFPHGLTQIKIKDASSSATLTLDTGTHFIVERLE